MLKKSSLTLHQKRDFRLQNLIPQKEGSSGIVITNFHMLQKSLYHSSLAFEN